MRNRTKNTVYAIMLGLTAIGLGIALSLLGGKTAAAEPAAEVMAEISESTPRITESFAYETSLFDTGYVHTIDVIVDPAVWEEFQETCKDKEYIACDLVIDGEPFENAAIRAKGNSSLNMLRAGQKYSYKIEFDHYREETFRGLDKLNLNNLIMDESCMKDYLVYRMMSDFGVDAPLCSYIFMTVNGEDWGLYLAVEGVEDSFLARNYGLDHGALYKPDNISQHKGDENNGFPGGDGMPMPMPSFEMSSGESDDAQEPAAETASEEPADEAEPVDADDGPPSREMPGGFGGMGASDVKLQYIDGDPESYPNIFDSVKTEISRKDKYRLIESLRKLSEREELEEILDIDELLRYFASHIFVCNNDSYTGGMVHNYYLYEENGRLSMIPWDYNLAFGAQGRSAASAVNDPIDTPVGGGEEQRPMLYWMLAEPAYLEAYHATLLEFLDRYCDSGWIDDTIEETKTLLADYVKRDTHSFCTYDEMIEAADELALFCRLRAESVHGQLSGAIPSTTTGQALDSSNLVDTSELKSASGEPSFEMPSGEASE